MRAPSPEAQVPRVLVLMATFNGAQWVGEQVRSIAAQDGVAVTLLISDDGSTDDTLAKIVATAADHIQFKIVRSELPGGSAAKNFFRLIDAADSTDHDFVALADQDDLWEPGKLTRAAERLAGGSAVGYSAPVRAFWPDGRTVRLYQCPNQTLADYVFEGAGQGCTFVFRVSHFTLLQRILALHRDRLLGLHYHDWTLYSISRALGHRWIFDDWVCLQYRQHAGNDTGARSGTFGIAKRLDMIRSGWYGAQVNAVTRLCLIVTSGKSEGAAKYQHLVESARSGVTGRLFLAIFVLRHGRRRWSDRFVLACAAIGGYLHKPLATDVL